MKITIAFLGLLSLAAAQFGKGKSKGGSGGLFGKKGSGGLGKGSGSVADLMSCVSKCNQDILGIDMSAAMSGGGAPSNLPCSDKMPKMTDISGGKMPDVVPLLTCVCGQPKIKSTLNCVAKCPGGSMLGMAQSQFEKDCKDPKAAADQLNSLVSKFSEMASGMGGMGGMGSKGSKGSKGGLGKLGKGKGKQGKGF